MSISFSPWIEIFCWTYYNNSILCPYSSLYFLSIYNMSVPSCLYIKQILFTIDVLQQTQQQRDLHLIINFHFRSN